MKEALLIYHLALFVFVIRLVVVMWGIFVCLCA